ncbi:MAG: M20/M25/M40 family metallo-hydrolase [Alphaproteobacteria bacterium]|nr:M20/M25/M40 family metallo-hydrolase [Alphaproteobacteria bacterium]
MEPHIEILKDLVAFDTTSHKSNLMMIDYIRAKLAVCHGVRTHLDMNADGTKANLIASIGPEVDGGILLSGHTDVVPVDGQAWDTDPWTLTQKADGFLYGRGTTDMKGFVACVLSQVEAWSTSKLTKPIHLVFSFDEEVGCKGVITAIDVLKAQHIKPDLCIVGEPTEMQMAVAHNSRAKIWFNASATGGHASKYNDPTITSAHDVMTVLSGTLMRTRGEYGALLGDEMLGHASMASTGVKTPYTNNVIPSGYENHYDFRGRPGITPAALENFFSHTAHAAVVEYKTLMDKSGHADLTVRVEMMNPGFKCTDDAAIKMGQLFVGNGEAITVPYVCEAARFWDAGFVKTIVVGPGNILQAHQPNEYIDPAQLKACNDFLGRVVASITAPSQAPAP